MKKCLLFFIVVLLTLTGCNVDKAKINNISIENLEYLSGNFISFNVSVKPNAFDSAKVYLVPKKAYDANEYGNAIHEYAEKMPAGKFTVSYETLESSLYYLFVSVKGKDLKMYDSEIVEIDLIREEPTVTAEIVSNFSDNITLKLTDVEKDIKTISYCLVGDDTTTECEDPQLLEKYNELLLIKKNENKYVLFLVEDLIGNNKSFIIDTSIN